MKSIQSKIKILTIILITHFLTGCIVTEAINDLKTDYLWKGLGDANSWNRVGVKTPEEAKKWIKLGINSKQCNNAFCKGQYVWNWMKRGIKTPEEAKNWTNSTLDDHEIFGYIDAGVTSVETAKKWQEIENKAQCGSYAEKCIKSGITNPDNVELLLDVGLNTNEVIAYLSFGASSLNQAKAWKKAGVTVSQIDRWKDKGVTIDKAMQELAKNNEWNQLDAKHVNKWKETGLTPKEAQVWIDAKIPDAPYWIDAGISDINVAKKWVKAGIPDGHNWFRNGFTQLNDVKNWKKLGVSGPLAYEIKSKNKVSSSQLVKSCGSILGYADFVSGNPYAHVNKCVSTCIQVTQIVSKNQVFARAHHNSERMVSASAPNNLLDDFVVNKLACGIYKIQATEKFKLTGGDMVMGNVFKRIASHD